MLRGLATQSPSRQQPMGARSWTAHDLLSWRRRCLAQGGRRADFDWLLDLAGGLPWSELQRLHLDPARPVQLVCPVASLEALWQRHLAGGEPLQYLLGLCPWRDLELKVGPGVLIPRQETELLVELAGGLVAVPPALWADLGTGSGCLAAALAGLWPGSSGLAVDLSPEALRQAEANLETVGALSRVRLLQGHWWDPLQPWWGALGLVLANPPYIPSAVWAGLEPGVRDHEPRLALDGGPDGLRSLRTIARGGAQALAPGGVLVLEHHHDQSGAVLGLLRQAGLQQVQAHRDLEGVLRFASARRPLP